MSNITNHVVSLELAKKLKELGYPQEALYYWSKAEGGKGRYFIEIADLVCDDISHKHGLIAAPIASELGEWFDQIKDYDYGELVEMYWDEKGDDFNHKEEASQRAEVLIWAIENNYFSFKDK